MRNESLDYLIRLLKGTEKPILISNRHKLLSNEELAAIVSNATKNVDSHLDTIHTNFQQHCRQYCTDCHEYYSKSYGSSHSMRGRYIGLGETICSICSYKWHGYLSSSWIGPVLQRAKEF